MQGEFASGTIIGGEYVVDRLIGRGGMGAVYLARQQSTNRLRALKILEGSVVRDERAAERFAREAMVGSLIKSQHVVEVIGAGVDVSQGGRIPWLAMEYLEGEELSQNIARRGIQGLPPKQAVVVLSQVFHAIIAAHEAGIVHRDIKPENVYLARTNIVGVPFLTKVLDFGISKVTSEYRTGAQTKTIGTPGWLAPEQLESGKSVAATDVWSLGLLTFFTLTGCRFWMREHDEHASLQMLMYEMMVKPIPLASERAAEFRRAQLIPAGFDDWFARCVNRDTLARYQDAGQAWEALEAILSGQQISTQLEPVSEAEQAVASSLDPQTTGGTPAVTLGAGWNTGQTDSQNTAPLPEPVTERRESIPKKRGTRVTALVGVGALVIVAGSAVAIVSLIKSNSSDTSKAGTTGQATAAKLVAPPQTVMPSSAPVLAVAASPPAPAPSASAQRDTIALPAGSVVIDDKTVSVAAFEIDRTEATVKKWGECVAAAVCNEDVTTVNVPGAQPWSVLCNWSRRGELGDHAMNCVSYPQAKKFCQWAGKRLPTDAEWYYAAHVAGGQRKYAWGNADPPAVGGVNLCGSECATMLRGSNLWAKIEPMPGHRDSYASTSPVLAFDSDKTPSGVIGMGGNVMEWTATPYDVGQMRCRGANWLSVKLDDAAGSPVYSVDAQQRRTNLGFRCAK